MIWLVRASGRGKTGRGFLLAALLCSLAGPGSANEPCSGRKGGIATCQGDTFICNDGSVSGSKRSCTAYMGASSLFGAAAEMTPGVEGACVCRDGNFCIGPRGGRYGLRDDGQKSYLKK